MVILAVAGFDARLRESRLPAAAEAKNEKRRVIDKIRAAASTNYLIWMLVGRSEKPRELQHPSKANVCYSDDHLALAFRTFIMHEKLFGQSTSLKSWVL